MLFGKKTVRDVDVKGKVCLVRVDFNVQIKNGQVTDDKRIRESLPTIFHLIGRGAKIILLSHLGRPKGEKTAETSLAPVVRRLHRYIQHDEIPLLDIDNDVSTRIAIKQLRCGDVMMLENMRWYTDEKKDPDAFGKHLASFGDLFINNGFAVSHREHGSVVGIAKHLPAVAGLLLEQEVKHMELTVMKRQAHPFVAIVGGKKCEEKIPVIDALLDRADIVLTGGGVVNTFFKARGHEIGRSFYEEHMIQQAKSLSWKAMQCNTALHLPTDMIVAPGFAANAPAHPVAIDQIPADHMAMDIGPRTIAHYESLIAKAGFVMWIGPMGVYEFPSFRVGNDAIAAAVGTSQCTSFLGGGDTITSISHHWAKAAISHISTGGGAALHYLQYNTLPGLEVLQDKNQE